MPKQLVLFLCNANSARSQMAEAFLKRLGGDGFEALSAGLKPTTVHPLAVQVMNEIGYNLEGQRAKSVNEYLGQTRVHTLISVCEPTEADCPQTWPGAMQKMAWSFEDPAALTGTETERLDKFREVRDQIHERIRLWLAGDTGFPKPAHPN